MLSLSLLAEQEETRHQVESWGALSFGVDSLRIGIAYAAAPPPGFSNHERLAWGLSFGLGGAAIAGMGMLGIAFSDSESRRILDEYLAADRSTAALEAKATQAAEREWESVATKSRLGRKIYQMDIRRRVTRARRPWA